MNWRKKVRESEFIISFGSGQAFELFLETSKINFDLIIDNDFKKWGSFKNEVLIDSPGKLKEIKKESFLIIVLSSYEKEIVEQLKKENISEDNIIKLSDLVERDKEYAHKYGRVVRKKKAINELERKREINYKKMFFDWLDLVKEFKYKNISLGNLLASDIALLFDYVLNVDIETNLYEHPREEEYVIYGRGEIVAPYFIRSRPEHFDLLNSVIKEKEKCFSLITYRDVEVPRNVKLLSRKYLSFRFNQGKTNKYFNNIILLFEEYFFILGDHEKKWLTYSIQFYIQMIDFYYENFNFATKCLYTILPHYGEENILLQLSDLKKIPKVNYQHGNYMDLSINQESPSFGWFLNLYNSRCDYYIVWGEIYKRILRKNGIDETKVLCLGNPKKKYELSEIKILNDDTRKNAFLVVLMGPTIDSYLFNQQLIEFAERLARETGNVYYIKPHPLYALNVEENTLRRCKKILTNDVFSEIHNFDFVVAASSTLITELMLYQLPVFIFFDTTIENNGIAKDHFKLSSYQQLFDKVKELNDTRYYEMLKKQAECLAKQYFTIDYIPSRIKYQKFLTNLIGEPFGGD